MMVSTPTNSQGNNVEKKSKQSRKRKVPVTSGRSFSVNQASTCSGTVSATSQKNVPQESSSSSSSSVAIINTDAKASAIQGIPPDLSPLLIQAIKAQKKLLLNVIKHYQKQRNENNVDLIANSLTATSNADADADADAVTNRSAQDDILNRMEEEETKGRQKQIMDEVPTGIKTQYEIVIQSMNELLDRLKLEERKETKKTKYKSRRMNSTHSNDINFDDQALKDQHPKTCISCLRFMFDLVQDEDNKLTLRHAAVLVASNIIQHTIYVLECQFFLVQSSSNKNANNHNHSYPMKKVIDSIQLNNNQESTQHHHRRHHRHQERQPQGDDKNQWMKNQILYEVWKIYNFILKHKLRNKYYDPKIIITIRYLEEKKGVVIPNFGVRDNSYITEISLNKLLISLYNSNGNCSSHVGNASCISSNVTTSMVEKRNIRDIAIKYCERQIKRVDRILKCMNECMEVIVPRFGKNENFSKLDESNSAPINTPPPSLDDSNMEDEKIAHVPNECDTMKNVDGEAEDDNDDEEEDIDWEDGDDEDLLFTSYNDDIDQDDNQSGNEVLNHKVAVENTLAMMKETGALNQEGNLQVTVDLSSTGFGQSDRDDRSKVEAREKLTSCVNLLVDRHQPRLKSWLDALNSADNMTSSTTNNKSNSSSNDNMNVILLPESTRRKREAVLQSIRGINNQVNTALSLARKMGIQIRKESLDRSMLSNRQNSMKDHQTNYSARGTIFVQDGSNKPNNDPQWRHALGIITSKKKEAKRPMSRSKKRVKLRGKVMIKLRDS